MRLFYQIYAEGSTQEIYGSNVPLFRPARFAALLNCIITKLGKLKSFIDDGKQYKIYLDDEYSTEIKIARNIGGEFLHVSSTSTERTETVFKTLTSMFDNTSFDEFEEES